MFNESYMCVDYTHVCACLTLCVCVCVCCLLYTSKMCIRDRCTVTAVFRTLHARGFCFLLSLLQISYFSVVHTLLPEHFYLPSFRFLFGTQFNNFLSRQPSGIRTTWQYHKRCFIFIVSPIVLSTLIRLLMFSFIMRCCLNNPQDFLQTFSSTGWYYSLWEFLHIPKIQNHK